MKRSLTAVSPGLFLLSMSILASGVEAAKGPFASPTEIQPLLLGTTVPDVNVRQLDGSEANLAELVSAAPTVLIFYRGGW